MIKNHILPAIAGIISAIIFWGVGGMVIRLLPMSDVLKGLLIVLGAALVGALVNNFFAKRAKG